VTIRLAEENGSKGTRPRRNSDTGVKRQSHGGLREPVGVFRGQEDSLRNINREELAGLTSGAASG